MSARVFHHAPNAQGPVEVTSGAGVFQTDSAYVVLTETPANVYVWTGVAVNQDSRAAATKHATTLLGEAGVDEINVQFEVQAQESDAFAALFAALEYVEPAVEAEPEQLAAVEAAVAAVGTAAAAAASKKKKKKKKKKGGAGAAGVAVVSGAAGAEEDDEEEEEEAGAVVAAEVVAAAEPAVEVQPEPEPEAAPQPGPAEAAVIAELEQKLEIAKPEPAAAEAEAVVAVEAEVVAEPEPAPASPAPAPKAATPAASPQVKPTLAAAMPAASPTAASPASIAAAKTYLADSAAAWGGVAAAPVSSGAAIAPGSKTFSYEELKALRADSGIDMTQKEAYLSDADFAKVFGKDKAAFNAQPGWRRQLQKKEVGLW